MKTFLSKLPKFRVVREHLFLGFFGAVLGLIGTYLSCQAGIDCGDEWSLGLIIFAIPMVVAGTVVGLLLGITSRRPWVAILGGIIGSAGLLFSIITDGVALVGMFLGALLGLVYGKTNKVWAVLLGGIIGFSLAILGFILYWH